MKVVEGDLLKLAAEGHFDVIVHGCNCFCRMGAGIAAVIRQRFPEAFEADLATDAGDRGKLGTITTATTPAGLTVVNAYTQFDTSGPMPRVDYDAVRRAFAEIKAKFAGRRIGYPKIGAGLAGGDWDQLAAIIDQALAGENHTLVVLPQSR